MRNPSFVITLGQLHLSLEESQQVLVWLHQFLFILLLKEEYVQLLVTLQKTKHRHTLITQYATLHPMVRSDSTRQQCWRFICTFHYIYPSSAFFHLGNLSKRVYRT